MVRSGDGHIDPTFVDPERPNLRIVDRRHSSSIQCGSITCEMITVLSRHLHSFKER